MTLWATITAVAALLMLRTAFAAEPLRVDISSAEEEKGRIAVALNVIGADGRPVANLAPANFKASLDGTPVAISDVLTASVNRQPASVVLLVDVSGSMAGEPINQARTAMLEFIRGLDSADRVAIVVFGAKVTLLQDFTANRTLLTQAIQRVAAAGDTALYDGVLQGLSKIGEAPPGRRLMVVLSDGQATTSLGRRGETIAAAAAGGINVMTVGLGPDIDRPYLNELSGASGGRFLDAPTPSALKQAYADLANAIKSQYTLMIAVPQSMDRTGPAKLTVQVDARGETATAERALAPLAGALPPPFEIKVSGITPSTPLKAPASLQAEGAAGITMTSVEYSLDGKPLYTAAAPPFAYTLDSAPLALGKHILKVSGVDERGRRGEATITFTVAAPAKGGSSVGPMLLIGVLLAVVIAALSYVVLRKKRSEVSQNAARIRPFARRSEEPIRVQIDGWPTQAPQTPLPPPPAPVNRPLGRVVVMEEEAVRNGDLDAIHEYEIKSQPLTLGTGEGCDIRIKDETGRIAAEEARLWVQKGRLVYHKLTTLSAMATEGVTSGWEFLNSGDDMRIGRYRVLFQIEQPQDEPLPPEEIAAIQERQSRPVQEHGMTLSDLWKQAADDAQLNTDPAFRAVNE